MVYNHVGRYLWVAGARVPVPSQVGYDWVDGILHPSYPCFLVLFTSILVLENGRFLLGCHSCCHGRKRKEDGRPRKFFFAARFSTRYLSRIQDEGKFDPRAIPLKSWQDYENELWDKESNHSIGSWVPPSKKLNEGYAESRTASLYGRETYYDPPGSRSYSPAPSHMYQPPMQPPPGYQSGRNTPINNPSYSQHFRPMSEVGMLQQPVASRPVTNYLDMPIPTTHSSEGHDFGMGGAMGPSDAELERAVADVLQGADLNTVTKKNVRQRLEGQFGVDLSSRKAVINAAIDRVILSQS